MRSHPLRMLDTVGCCSVASPGPLETGSFTTDETHRHPEGRPLGRARETVSMYRRLGFLLAAAFFVGALASGCEAPGVGDPCDPESTPADGFVGSEAYLETSSVQCRTRVCMVYKLTGLPNYLDSNGLPTCNDPTPGRCASLTDTYNRVYCTCRCGAPPGTSARLCECPDGFSCVEIIDSPAAGAGIRGSYCVRDGTFTEER